MLVSIDDVIFCSEDKAVEVRHGKHEEYIRFEIDGNEMKKHGNRTDFMERLNVTRTMINKNLLKI